MSVASLMTGQINLQQQTTGQDASGGATRSPWSNIVSNEPCDIQPVSNDVRMFYQRRNSVVSHTVYLARDIGARANMRLQLPDGSRTFVYKGSRPGLLRRGYSAEPEYYQIDVEEVLSSDAVSGAVSSGSSSGNPNALTDSAGNVLTGSV